MNKRYIKTLPNFLEIETIEDVNRVNLKVYSFIRYSETRNKFLFKKRAGVEE